MKCFALLCVGDVGGEKTILKNRKIAGGMLIKSQAFYNTSVSRLQ